QRDSLVRSFDQFWRELPRSVREQGEGLRKRLDNVWHELALSLGLNGNVERYVELFRMVGEPERPLTRPHEAPIRVREPGVRRVRPGTRRRLSLWNPVAGARGNECRHGPDGRRLDEVAHRQATAERVPHPVQK